MKKLLLVMLILISMAFTTQSEYCEGWEDGYCEGYKDVKGDLSICPITPICPIAGIGKNNYRGGYNRGFKAGAASAFN